MSKFTLPASNGRESIVLELVAPVTSDGLLLEVLLQGSFWDRASGDFIHAELKEDFFFRLPQVCVSKTQVNLLTEELRDWIKNKNSMSLLLGKDDQTMKLSLVQSEKLISSENKPAFEFEYSAGGLIGVFVTYLVDETCVSNFLIELEQLISIGE